MINKNIVSVLVNHNFNIMKNTNPQYHFFCKSSDDSFSTVVLMDDINFPNKTDSLLLDSIKDSLEKTFYLRGFKHVDVLFVIFTNNPFDYKSLADSDFTFWLSDMTNFRIVSYASEDGVFSTIREEFENALIQPEKKPIFASGVNGLNIHKKPFFTILFAIINIIIFTGFELFGDMEDTLYLYGYGANEWHSVLEQHQYYRLFTCMFLHFSLSHLVSNMTSLVAVGSQLESSIGHIKFMIIYITSGLCASLTSVLYHAYTGTSAISAGASGAIFGLFGAYAVFALFDKLRGRSVPATKIAVISLLMLLNGMSSASVDNAAHLGGIISGCIIAFICCICNKNKI